MVSPVLVMLDSRTFLPRLLDAATPVIRADEDGYLRGDGIFETLSVIGGRVHGLGEHLERLRASAAAVSLAIPEAEAWSEAITAGLGAHDARHELTVRLTAGFGAAGEPATCIVRVEPTADSRSLRRDGVAVVVLDRGYARGATADAPWLLAGVKTTSGAVTRAALREARSRGADDLVWRSSDGWLLEGATSSLLIRSGESLRTPRTEAGILDGTTVTRLLTAGERSGLATERAWLRTSDLHDADAAWLVSSTRRAVPVRAVDGVALTIDRELTSTFEQVLSGPPS